MILLAVGTPGPIVRGLQGWKELVLLALILRIGFDTWRERAGWIGRLRATLNAAPWQMRLLDATAIAFTLLLCVYLIASTASVFGTSISVTQRLLSFRIFILIPLLYGLGRVFGPRDPEALRISFTPRSNQRRVGTNQSSTRPITATETAAATTK